MITQSRPPTRHCYPETKLLNKTILLRLTHTVFLRSQHSYSHRAKHIQWIRLYCVQNLQVAKVTTDEEQAIRVVHITQRVFQCHWSPACLLFQCRNTALTAPKGISLPLVQQETNTISLPVQCLLSAPYASWMHYSMWLLESRTVPTEDESLLEPRSEHCSRRQRVLAPSLLSTLFMRQ